MASVPGGTHAAHCGDLHASQLPTPDVIQTETGLIGVNRHVLENAMARTGLGWIALDHFGMGQNGMDRCGTGQVGIDQNAPIQLRRPGVAPVARHEAGQGQDSSHVAIHDVRGCLFRIANFRLYGVCHPSEDGHYGWIGDHVAVRRTDVQNEDSWGFEALFRRLFGASQLIQELRKAVWIVQKQPANHCLKSSGLAIGRCISRTRTAAGAVAATTNQSLFLVVEPGLKTLQRTGLSVRSHFGHDGTMQII